jgi:ATP-dependent DNA ligase
VKPAELLRAAEALQFERVIAKRKGSIYEPGKRSRAWLKYKLNQAQEFVIGAYCSSSQLRIFIRSFSTHSLSYTNGDAHITIAAGT